MSITDHRTDARATPDVESPGAPTRGSPVTILRIYVVVLVLIPPTHIIDPLGAVGTPSTVIALVVLVLWCLGLLAPGKYLCRTVVPVRVVMGVLVATTISAYAVLHVRYVPAVELLASDRALLQVLSWVGVSLLAAEGLRDRDEVYSVLRALVAAVAVMAVVGFLQFRFGLDLAENVNRIPGLHQNADLVSIQDRSGFRRPAGTATHPIEFGCVIAMTLPIALHLARFDLARSPMRRWLPVGAIMIGIPVAVSRSAVLAAAVAAIVVFAGLDPKLRPRALGVVAAFLVATYATTPGLLGTLGSLFINAGSDTSISYRTNDYATVSEYIQQSPWLGRGPGTFVAGSYIVLDNQYLLSAIEVGLVGLSVVIGYLIATAFLGRGARHQTKDPAIRDLGQAFAATSLASAIAALTFDAFSFLIFAGFVPLCLGVAGALWKLTRTGTGRTGAPTPLDDGWQGGLREQLSGPLPSPPAVHGPGGDGDGRAIDGEHVGVSGGRPVELVGSVASSAAQSPLAEFVDGVEHPSTGRSDSRRRAAVIGAGVGAMLLGGLALGVGRGSGDDPDAAVAQVVASPSLTPPSASTTVSATDTPANRPSATTAPRPTIIAMARPDTGPAIRPLRTDTEVAVTPRPGSPLFPSSPLTPPPTGGPTPTTNPTTPTTRPPTATTVPPTTTTTTSPPTTTTTTPPATTTTTPPATEPPPPPDPPPPPP